MDKNERMRLMGEGSVTVALLRLGMPMVVNMLVTALYGILIIIRTSVTMSL